jgi:hypothetical protein
VSGEECWNCSSQSVEGVDDFGWRGYDFVCDLMACGVEFKESMAWKVVTFRIAEI